MQFGILESPAQLNVERFLAAGHADMEIENLAPVVLAVVPAGIEIGLGDVK